MINLSRVDLNLLVVLDMILSEGGVSRAAAKLNLTQPTISHALGRLREQFDDPLFVRHGRTLVPTPLARSLREPLAAALHSLGSVLAAGRRFDPAQTAATFTVAMRDPMELVVLPALARQLAAAPQVELRAVQVRRRSIEAALADGSIDAAVDMPLPFSDRIRRHKVVAADFVIVVRAGHPRLRRKPTLAAYVDQQHLMVSSRRRGPALEDLALGQLGVHRRVRLRCRSYAAASRIVAESDFVLTMPRRYAELLNEAYGNRILRMPMAMPALDLYLYWHEAMDGDGGNRWLRTALLDALNKGSVDVR
ncbi:LysR family transcriptional regulator [Reyranella sp.]|uniref:LysR family transcriptional regulator n=1 Tax=Reyranella sp. TaxID=1929291 RepID=UPI003D0AED34